MILRSFLISTTQWKGVESVLYDVIIIGAGVTGSAVARELSRYKLNVCVLDKEEDVCCGTSKANSAIVHAGFDAAEGSLMARFNVRGNEMMGDLARDLDIPFKRNGALVVCIHESEKDGLKDLYNRGIANGVKELKNNGEYKTRYVINAAGVYADYFHNMVSANKIHITPRRGDYCLLDKTVGNHVSHTIFPQPTKLGKGVLVSPTVHGNLIVGPTAVDIENKEGNNTTAAGIADLIAKANDHVKNLPMRQVITSFAGLRAHEDHHEFIIGEVEDAPHFIDCAGIESPGLTSCPAIGEYVGLMLKEKMGLEEKENWVGTRKGILNPADLSIEERNELIKKNPAYGRIICRCESVTEGEIIDAIHRPLGARSLDGVKRRTRAGMGRCQAGFCSPRTMEIINRELGLPLTEITKSGGDSKLVIERTKGVEA